ncbi:MAG: hypothetical protein EOM20_11255 [Spartobacteria bacterium]|nr:hypothetical protein [Spartobacteria bacterium]
MRPASPVGSAYPRAPGRLVCAKIGMVAAPELRLSGRSGGPVGSGRGQGGPGLVEVPVPVGFGPVGFNGRVQWSVVPVGLGGVLASGVGLVTVWPGVRFD